MNFAEFCLLLMSIIANVSGQFFFKSGALKLGKVNLSNLFTHVLNIVTIPELMVGLTCYGLGAIAYILVLTRVKLSIVGPCTALSYVFAVVLGYWIFKETIPLTRILGLSLIVNGVILVVWKQ